jgi:hypothetical protein
LLAASLLACLVILHILGSHSDVQLGSGKPIPL